MSDEIMKTNRAGFAKMLVGAKILWAFTQKGEFDGESEFSGEDVTHYIIEKDGVATYWKEEEGQYTRALDFMNNIENMFSEQLEIAKSFNALLKVIEDLKKPKVESSFSPEAWEALKEHMQNASRQAAENTVTYGGGVKDFKFMPTIENAK